VADNGKSRYKHSFFTCSFRTGPKSKMLPRDNKLYPLVSVLVMLALTVVPPRCASRTSREAKAVVALIARIEKVCFML
jgi:hypothetical protein